VNEDLATQLRTVFNDRDIDALRPLLATGATWGDDPGSESFCHDRDGILRRLKMLLAAGVRPTIVETTTGQRGIAARIEVEWPNAEAPQGRITYAQAYLVDDGLVTEIHGYDDIDSAVAAVSR
jgi:hypothetical protein